jgi:hypothetical protein
LRHFFHTGGGKAFLDKQVERGSQQFSWASLFAP